MPKDSRQAMVGPGSGPVSTRTAVVSSARSTVASPCPTSQKTACHRPGQSNGTGRIHPASSSPRASSRKPARRRSPARASTAATPASRALVSIPSGVVGHSRTAPGMAAPRCAIQRMGCTTQPATQATAAATGGTQIKTVAASPSTVAGPTKGPARALAITPTTDT